jgi:hypothetical protein
VTDHKSVAATSIPAQVDYDHYLLTLKEEIRNGQSRERAAINFSFHHTLEHLLH